MVKFEWDSAKAAANAKKHGVSFEEAQSVFYDEFAVQFFDDEHSSNEERFLLLGMSTREGCCLFAIANDMLAMPFGLFLPARRPGAKANSMEAKSHESRIRSIQDEVAQESLRIEA